MSAVCTVEFTMQFASAGCAVLAAGFWFGASVVEAPTEIPKTKEGRVAIGADMIPAVEKLMTAVGSQSKRNAIAAFFAGVAATLQISQAFMPTCG